MHLIYQASHSKNAFLLNFSLETAALRTGLVDMIANVKVPKIDFEPSW